MKIKDGCSATTGDFWYDLTDGGYLNPAEILEDEADVIRVNEAIAVIQEFEQSCTEQIEGFMQ